MFMETITLDNKYWMKFHEAMDNKLFLKQI